MSSEAAESSRDREEAAEREASEERPWVALSTIPVVLSANDERAEGIVSGTDLVLDVHDPPRATYLLLPSRLAPGPGWPPHPLPTVATAEPTARFIFTAAQKEGAFDLDYFLCDGHSRTASRLPDVPSTLGVHLYPRRRSLGLTSNPHRLGHYIVAQLHPPSAARYDTLLYYSTATRAWGTKPLASSPEHKPWGAHGVFAHDGLLWWVDAAYGLLVCDPFLNRPELRFIPLPDGCEMEGPIVSRSLIDKRRFVRPSEGKLRYVEIRGLSYDPAAVDEPQDNAAVWMWTLADPDGPRHRQWKREYEASFADIWAHDSYIAAGLTPGKVPALALIDPTNHGVIYFFQGASLFGLDMRAGEVVTCERQCFMDYGNQGDLRFQYSRFVDAWEVPPTLVANPSCHGGSGSTDDHEWDLQETRSKIISINGPNPLLYLRLNEPQLEPQPQACQERGDDPTKVLHESLSNIQMKLEQETNWSTIEKLIREKKYIQELLQGLDFYDDKCLN